LLEDAKGTKKDAHKIPAFGKRLKMLLCLKFPDYKPSFYVHVFADHSADYLKELNRISGLVGFQVTLKMLSQDAVEAGHKFVISFFFFFFSHAVITDWIQL